MTTTLPSESTSPSRRALLAGALGGLGALAAGAIGRPTATQAANGDPVLIAVSNTGTGTTSVTNSSTGDVFAAHSTTGDCLNGFGVSGRGVYGSSSSNSGVYGQSSTGVGIYAYGFATNQPAALGWSRGHSTGVQGYSGDTVPADKPKTGVYGYAAQDGLSRGVFGESPAGHGVHGHSASGWAGYFSGKVFTSKFHELKEISAPSAPKAHRGRLFLRENGAKTELCIRFNTGAIQVLATQP